MKFWLGALIAVAATTANAQVYKCPAPGGGTTYTDKPCDISAEPHRVRNSSFGSDPRRAEMHLTGTACTVDHGYGTATGFVVNMTPVAREARVTSTFLRRGAVVDTMTHTRQVPAHGRTPFSMTLGGSPDRCEYQISWE